MTSASGGHLQWNGKGKRGWRLAAPFTGLFLMLLNQETKQAKGRCLCYRPLPMPDKPKTPLNFDPRAALLINQKKFVVKITVDMTTGEMAMEHEGPDLGALAVLDLLNTQSQVILRQLLLNPNFPNPSIAPPGGSTIAGDNSEQKDGEKVT